MIKALKISAFALVALLGVLGAELSQAVAEGFLVPQEEQMHGLVNQTRAERGLSQLPNNDSLRTLARRQAQNMAAAGYIYHTPNLAAAAKSLAINYSLLGENVGVGPSVEAVQAAFLASPHHLENIVDPQFNALGVGATSGANAALYFSQNFGDLRSANAAAAAPVSATARPRSAVATTSRPATQVAGVQRTPVPVPAATPVPTPVPVNQFVTRIPATLDHYPSMAGAPVAAQGIFASRPSSPAASLQRSENSSVSLPMTVGSMFTRFFAKLAFWK